MASYVRNNTTNAINLASAWTGGVLPGAADVGQWTSGTSAASNTLSGNWTVGALDIGAFKVDISGSTFTITLLGNISYNSGSWGLYLANTASPIGYTMTTTTATGSTNQNWYIGTNRFWDIFGSTNITGNGILSISGGGTPASYNVLGFSGIWRLVNTFMTFGTDNAFGASSTIRIDTEAGKELVNGIVAYPRTNGFTSANKFEVLNSFATHIQGWETSVGTGTYTLTNTVEMQAANKTIHIHGGTLALTTLTATGSGNAPIFAGAGALHKVGSGTWIPLTQSSSRAGSTTVKAGGGAIRVANNTALGSGAVAVESGAALELSGGLTAFATSGGITLNGQGSGNLGALQSVSGTNQVAATITLPGSGVVSVGATSGNKLQLNGVVSGGGGAGDFATRGIGTVALTGNNKSFSSNLYACSTVTEVDNISTSGSVGGAGTPIYLAVDNVASVNPTLKYVGSASSTTTRGVSLATDLTPASRINLTFTLDSSGTGTAVPTYNGSFAFRDTGWTTDTKLILTGTQANGTATLGTGLSNPSGTGSPKLALDKTGNSVWRITATTTNTGPTEVNAGTLIGDHDSATPSARFGGGNVRLNSGGTLKTLTGTSQLGRMNYASGLRLNGGTLQIGGTA